MNRPVPPGQSISCRTNLFAVGVPRCIVKVRFLIPITTGLGFTPGWPISRILCRAGFPRHGDDHLSGTQVALRLVQSTRGFTPEGAGTGSPRRRRVRRPFAPA